MQGSLRKIKPFLPCKSACVQCEVIVRSLTGIENNFSNMCRAFFLLKLPISTNHYVILVVPEIIQYMS